MGKERRGGEKGGEVGGRGRWEVGWGERGRGAGGKGGNGRERKEGGRVRDIG